MKSRELNQFFFNELSDEQRLQLFMLFCESKIEAIKELSALFGKSSTTSALHHCFLNLNGYFELDLEYVLEKLPDNWLLGKSYIYSDKLERIMFEPSGIYYIEDARVPHVFETYDYYGHSHQKFLLKIKQIRTKHIKYQKI